MNDMTQAEHAMLWNGLLTWSFDEFWSINRKLMDCGDGSNVNQTYKHVPVRVYKPDMTYCQPYVVAVGEDNSINDVSISQVLKSVCIEVSDDVCVVSQGIEIPLGGSLYKLSQTLSYPDNFLYLTVTNLVT